MINSFVTHNTKDSLIVYNLGLDADKWINIQTQFRSHACILYKVFDYSKYPDWFNINNGAGQYAWKPTIIYSIYLEFPTENLVWMDAGNLITSNLTKLEQYIIENGIYSATSSGTILRWTHPTTIKYMNCTYVNMQNRNAACIGFNALNKCAVELLEEFYKCAQIKECIYPDGSSRANHRQDQAVFTILYYKYFSHNYITIDWRHHLCYSIHNDIEPHWDVR